MKCPFCKQELHDDHDGYYSCYTDNCPGGANLSGTKELWQMLIYIKTKLAIAVDGLYIILHDKNPVDYADNIIKQIRALKKDE